MYPPLRVDSARLRVTPTTLRNNRSCPPKGANVGVIRSPRKEPTRQNHSAHQSDAIQGWRFNDKRGVFVAIARPVDSRLAVQSVPTVGSPNVRFQPAT
jgi:hypothetical protein